LPSFFFQQMALCAFILQHLFRQIQYYAFNWNIATVPNYNSDNHFLCVVPWEFFFERPFLENFQVQFTVTCEVTENRYNWGSRWYSLYTRAKHRTGTCPFFFWQQ
jgi:hypothetical protein